MEIMTIGNGKLNNTMEQVREMALHLGASRAELVTVNEITLDASFRTLCESNACGNYGRNYMWPADAGDIYKKSNYIFENLKSSQDIPKIASTLPEFEKSLFLPILQKVFMSCINDEMFFDDLTIFINQNYPKQALINSLKLIEDAYRKQMSNVNFSYILDNLLFNILKEKFLCKQ